MAASLASAVGCASSNPGVMEDGGPYGTTGTSTTTTGTSTGSITGTSTGATTATTATTTGTTTDSTTVATSTTTGTTTSTTAATDGGADSGQDASVGVDANDPLNFSARCTSGVMWNGVTEDQNMRPGEACPTCHSNFYLAGTLYPTGHEPNGCDGVDGLTTSVTVVVTDATGNVITLYPNSVGNFYTSIIITPPFHAKVVMNGKERAMTPVQTIQSCNTCHTQTGANGAPGRITLPP